eukprot:365187-Chlamydomonas_euryale.AAC.9
MHALSRAAVVVAQASCGWIADLCQQRFAGLTKQFSNHMRSNVQAKQTAQHAAHTCILAGFEG